MNKNTHITISIKLVKLVGANAAILLEGLQEEYKRVKENEYGEFPYRVSSVEESLGLSRKEQSTAILRLKENGYLESVISRGMPKIRYFKLI